MVWERVLADKLFRDILGGAQGYNLAWDDGEGTFQTNITNGGFLALRF